jgi:hypothetical protein
MRVRNFEFENRARHFQDRQVENGSEVECLVGGGLYRRSAIEEVRYLSDRNLHGFEEYDLGARLRSRGWRLIRLNSYAVDHYSYQLGTYRLLWQRLRAGRLLALGEILQAAIPGHYLVGAVVELRPIRFALGTLLVWVIALLVASKLPNALLVIAFLGISATLPVLVMAARSGSLSVGAYSVLVWQLTGITLLLGLARARKPPTAAVPCRILHIASAIPPIGTVAQAAGSKLQPEPARPFQAEPDIGNAGPQPASSGPGACCGSVS